MEKISPPSTLLPQHCRPGQIDCAAIEQAISTTADGPPCRNCSRFFFLKSRGQNTPIRLETRYIQAGPHLSHRRQLHKSQHNQEKKKRMKFGVWTVLLIFAALLSLMALLWHPCSSYIQNRKARIAAAEAEYEEEMARYRAQSGCEGFRAAAGEQLEQNVHGRCAGAVETGTS